MNALVSSDEIDKLIFSHDGSFLLYDSIDRALKCVACSFMGKADLDFFDGGEIESEIFLPFPSSDFFLMILASGVRFLDRYLSSCCSCACYCSLSRFSSAMIFLTVLLMSSSASARLIIVS